MVLPQLICSMSASSATLLALVPVEPALMAAHVTLSTASAHVSQATLGEAGSSGILLVVAWQLFEGNMVACTPPQLAACTCVSLGMVACLSALRHLM